MEAKQWETWGLCGMNLRGLFSKQWFSECGPQTTATVITLSLLNMQMLGLHPKSETLGIKFV